VLSRTIDAVRAALNRPPSGRPAASSESSRDALACSRWSTRAPSPQSTTRNRADASAAFVAASIAGVFTVTGRALPACGLSVPPIDPDGTTPRPFMPR
jgi:hypothetical protein